MKNKIKLSDHFNFKRLIRFTLPSILMMILTSIYGVVDGFFVSNFVGKTSFAAVNFIMPFLMVVGAALATALGEIFGGIVPLIYFARKNSSRLKLCKPSWDFKSLIRICTNGSSELMSNISMSLVGMLYNAQLMKYAGEDGISAYGTIMYVNFIFLAVFIGYSTGIAPITSYHYGAGSKKELNNILKRSSVIIGIVAIAMCGISEFLANPLASVFVGYDKELLTMTTHAFRIYGIAFLFSGISIFGSAFFTALNDGLTSATIAFLRTLLFQCSSVLIMPIFFGLDGIWFSIIVAETLSVAVTITFLAIKNKKFGYWGKF